MAESRFTVLAALAADVAIMVTKFTVAGISGSSAMLAEGVHSLVDTGNTILLLVGLKLSQRPPSQDHPFGHGKEQYFWSLIVAVLVFGFGGGVSVFEGVLHIQQPIKLTDPKWNYIVLACAAVFESISFTVALRQFKSQGDRRPFWSALHQSKDPSVYTVLAEDGVALLGLAVAALGVWSSHALQMPVLDGVASIVIGLLLAAVAVLLMRESRGLLVGEGIQSDTANAIRDLASKYPDVRDVGVPLSMYIGPEDVLLTLDLDIHPGTPAEQVTRTVDAIEREIQARWPRIQRIYIDARSQDHGLPPQPAAMAGSNPSPPDVS